MPLYLISFYEEEESKPLKTEEGADPSDIHEAQKIATTRWPNRSMEVWCPGRVDYFTRKLEDTA
jgi:hypothetical protein